MTCATMRYRQTTSLCFVDKQYWYLQRSLHQLWFVNFGLTLSNSLRLLFTVVASKTSCRASFQRLLWRLFNSLQSMHSDTSATFCSVAEKRSCKCTNRSLICNRGIDLTFTCTVNSVRCQERTHTSVCGGGGDLT